MSTKTTLKRIALVAVSALGFGVLASAPSRAVDTATTVSTFTSSLSLSHTSATVVGYDTNNKDRSVAIFQMTAIGNNGQSAQLFAGETITASVSAVPAVSVANSAPAAADLKITPVSRNSSRVYASAVGGDNAASTNGLNASYSGAGSADDARIAAGGQPTRPNSVYYFAVTPAANKAVDAGTYTVKIRLSDISGFITSYDVTVNFVTSAADSGAVIVPTVTGTYIEGETSIAYTTARNMQATLRNANGGRVFASGSSDFNPVAPTLTAAFTTSAGVARAESLTIADSGVAAVDHVAITTATAATTSPVNAEVSAATKQAANVLVRALDGTYGITSSSTLGAPTATGDLLRVRYGSTSATAALTIVAAATAGTTAVSEVTATGSVVGADANDVYLPLSTTTATVSNKVTASSVAQTGYAVYYEVSYSTSCVAGNMTPAATTAPVKVLTDSNGVASLTITNAFPLDTCAATVTWTGAATNPTSTNVITWQKPAPAAAVSSPAGNYQALRASSNTVSWTIVDQFGNVMAGLPVQIALSGANAPTAAIATKTTSAAGQVSHTWTDAKASATATTDTISVSSVNGVAPTRTGAVTITYKAALDVVSRLEAKYQAPAATGVAAVTTDTLVPTTAIGGPVGIAVSPADQLDLTATYATAPTLTGTSWVKLNFTALDSARDAVTGVPTTITVTGAQLINSLGKLGTERTIFANEDIYVLGTKTGTATVTAKNGTLTSTATINFSNVAADARVLSVVESNGLVTATVRDAFGNAVGGVTVDVVGTGGAWLGNGATSASFVTAANGSVTFAVTGSGTITASLGSTYTKASFLAGAGNATGTVLTPGAPAGVRTASVTSAGQANAAEAAADAAAEAIDAANAATDAANLAAEAADAATVAAEEARDAADAATAAVEELATQVATLMAALKAQITTLANTVAKIAKKVRA